MPRPGDVLALDVEKPAAGGRMLARHDGQIVLVSGAIPGERIRARVGYVRGGVVFAEVDTVERVSPDRRANAADRSCGGNEYAHIAYERQCDLKREIVRDAFARIGRLQIPDEVTVHGSPERGYRMRARLHVQGERLGFYRQATHDLCDAIASGQLHESAGDAVAAISRALHDGKVESAHSLELSDNVAATDRALLLELDAERAEPGRWDAVLNVEGATGVGVTRRGRLLASRGTLSVTDELAIPARTGRLRLARRAGAFFQGNRYLLQALLDRVLATIPVGPLTDLYAGGGLFGLAHAASGRGRVQLVESERSSFADLSENARPYQSEVTLHAQDVERFLAGGPALDGAVIVDPPRTGLSREAAASLTASRASRLAYVSCDPATLARDSRRLADAQFALESVEIFDLFPTTAHVETLAVFRR